MSPNSTPSRRWTAIALSTLLVVAGMVVSGATSAGASSYPLNPAKTIKPPTYIDADSSPCPTAPTSTACTSTLVRALNDAREELGQPDYQLPTRFKSLTPAERMIVLSNQDRGLYGFSGVLALNSTLNSNAQAGVRGQHPPSGVSPVSGYPARGNTANIASGNVPMQNPLFAYYVWMYDDGPGSLFNGNCRHAGDAQCWVHRDATLHGFGSSNRVLMGIGHGYLAKDFYAWTELYESFAASAKVPMIPTVKGLSVHSGPATGGTSVVLSGYGMFRASGVQMFGENARITARSNTSLTVVTPAHAAGDGYLVVRTNGGTSSKNSASAFSYTG